MVPTELNTRDGAGLDILGRAYTVKVGHLRLGCIVRDSSQLVHASETVSNPPKGHHASFIKSFIIVLYNANITLPPHSQLDNAPSNSVVFISGPSDGPNALWGDLMSTAASAKGLKGAIVDGRVRDMRGLAEIGVPVSRWRGAYMAFGNPK
jgi:regulator of RNase E activity RraA